MPRSTAFWSIAASSAAVKSRFLSAPTFSLICSALLAPSKADFPGLFAYADFSQVQDAEDPAFWYDEIHPTEAGFGVLATGYNALVRAALPAAKRAAVG